MQREKGKVPTNINKDRVATGSPEIKSKKKDWSALIKQVDAKRKEGVPVTKLTEQISRKRATGEIQKPSPIIKSVEKVKSVNKTSHDH